MFHNLVFDWSGTLCDDLGPVLETVNRVLGHYGASPVDLETFRLQFRLPFGDFYQDRVPGVSHEELEAVYQQYYPQSRAGICPVPHAREFVHKMKGAGVRCFLLSAVTPSHFERQVREIGLVDVFESARLGVRDKRHQLPRFAAELGLIPGDTCYIGDMVHDVEAAREAGIASIAVLTGYDSASKLAAAGPDLLVPDLSRLAWWFERGARNALRP
ncbi:MAG: phosphoglycolate phosphatase [Verrucomicrobia bacterium]|nr:MAG: phosphoglycolate phosphatase [Verrucomicrobiota bacterium]